MSTTRNRTLTEDELGALVASSRAEQNLDPFITDPAVLAQVACLAVSALRARAGSPLPTRPRKSVRKSRGRKR